MTIFLHRRGFSLVELIVTVTIIAIMAAVSAGIVIAVVQLSIYMPATMKARMVAQEAVGVMIEGTKDLPGIRFATGVVDASDDQFTYTCGYPANNDKRNVRFLSSGNKIYRSYTGYGDPVSGPQGPYSSNEKIPYYAGGDVSITPYSQPGIFSYYKEDGSVWSTGVDPLNQIARVDIRMEVKVGSGFFSSMGSTFTVVTGIDIKRYNI